ncbi:hypothetical protein BJV77DRAFT_980200 [Russula vinacea]|nr:hypothetical protein BJV77DRAFT_980200 [Russula vinacea]
MAITCHDDLRFIQDVEVLTADAVEKYLSENDMPLLVMDGVTKLWGPRQRHREYFLADGDVIFKVENTVFRVHKYFFQRESSYFRLLFRSPSPCNNPPLPPGSSETNPVVLRTQQARPLLAFAGQYSIYTATVERWTDILDLAQRWAFKEVEQLCIRELQKLSIPPVEKIRIYQEFRLDRLTARPEPLSLEEGHKLGIETSLQIVQARELYRGSGTRASVVQLNDSELRSVIQDAFFDFSVADSFSLVRILLTSFVITLRRRDHRRRSGIWLISSFRE